MQVHHDEGRDAFLATVRGFLDAVEGLDDHALLAASRCHGWSVVDVVVHVQLGLHEVAEALLGLSAADPADRPDPLDHPDRDAASYWRDEPPGGGGDPVAGVLHVRRLGSAYRRPSLVLGPLRGTVASLSGAVTVLTPGRLRFQDHVLQTGDFLATWAVELAVHQLDLGLQTSVPAPHASGLALARRTAEALVGRPLPIPADARAVLVGTGRLAPDAAETAALGADAARLPAF